jgi:hypothetical protein
MRALIVFQHFPVTGDNPSVLTNGAKLLVWFANHRHMTKLTERQSLSYNTNFKKMIHQQF